MSQTFDRNGEVEKCLVSSVLIPLVSLIVYALTSESRSCFWSNGLICYWIDRFISQVFNN